MSRLKTFGKYILMIIAFYIFSTIVSIGFLKGTYNQMGGNVYQNESVKTQIEEAESTFVNGHIKGTLTNTSENDIQSKYLKIDLISEKGNIILSKYIFIEDLKSGETKNFTINFEAENIKSFDSRITDNYEQEESKVQLINLKDAENEEIKDISIFLAVIILAKYFIF